MAREVYDDFVAAFVDHTRTLQVGDPLDQATDVGPMVSARQRSKVEDQVEGAIAAGAQLVVGVTGRAGSAATTSRPRL
jgi:acyl-CoA reductase-like NAD-dependent aldehyde dehydrogenase